MCEFDDLQMCELNTIKSLLLIYSYPVINKKASRRAGTLQIYSINASCLLITAGGAAVAAITIQVEYETETKCVGQGIPVHTAA